MATKKRAAKRTEVGLEDLPAGSEWRPPTLPTLAAVRAALSVKAAERYGSNAKLAQAAGLSRSTVNTALLGTNDVRYKTLVTLMKAVGVDFAWAQKLA